MTKTEVWVTSTGSKCTDGQSLELALGVSSFPAISLQNHRGIHFVGSASLQCLLSQRKFAHKAQLPRLLRLILGRSVPSLDFGPILLGGA